MSWQSRFLWTGIVWLGMAISSVSAQTITLILEESDINPVTNDTDSDPRGIAVLGDGSTLYFFESETPTEENFTHSIVSFDTDGQTSPTIYVSEEQMVTGLNAVLSTSVTSISDIDDLTAGPDGTLYAIVRDENQDEHVCRMPPGGASLAVIVSNDSGAKGARFLDYDPANDRLVFYTDDANIPDGDAPADGDSSVTNQVLTVDPAASDTTPTPLLTAAQLDTALTAPGVAAGTADPSDLVVDPAGGIYLAFGYGAAADGNDGDILYYDGSDVSLLIAAADLNTATGAADGPGSAEELIIELVGFPNPAENELVVFDGAVDALFTISQAGTVSLLADEAALNAPTGNNNFGIDGKAMAIDDANGLYIADASGNPSIGSSELSFLLITGLGPRVNNVENFVLFD